MTSDALVPTGAPPSTRPTGGPDDRATSDTPLEADQTADPEGRRARRTPPSPRRPADVPAPNPPGRGGEPGGPDRLDRLGGWVVERRRRLIVAWLVVVAGLVVGFSSDFSDNLTAAAGTTPGSESARVETLLDEVFGFGEREQDLVVLESDRLTVADPRFASVVDQVIATVGADPGVIEVGSPLEPAGAEQIADDGRAAVVTMSVAGTPTERQDTAEAVGEALASLDTGEVDVWLTGASPLVADVDAVAQRDLARAETIGLPLALLVLFLAFGALVAAGLPLLLAAVGIGATFGILGVLSRVTEFNLLTENITTLIGLGVGVDFAMFIVARYREALASDLSPGEAARIAVATSGRSVLFSGLTTVLAMSALFFVDSPIFHDLAVAVMVTVTVMVAAALTLLPAVLAALGRRVDRGKLPGRRRSGDGSGRGWANVATAVMRRPGLVTLAAGALVLTLAAPALGLELGMSSGADAAADEPSGRGLAVLEEHFSPGAISPVEVVAVAEDGRIDTEAVAVETLLSALAADPGVVAADVEARTTEAVMLTAVPVAGADTAEAEALVERIRSDLAPLAGDRGIDVAVGGPTAQIIDQADEMASKLPIVVGFVLVITFGLLLVVFRSPLLAFKAIVMNLVSVGAAYGLVVLVFQHGLGESLFGFTSPGYIQSYLPLFAFVVLFGISMDYELFLLGRMREEWLRTGDNGAAVTEGMQRTARPITSAAAIQASIFGAFAFTSVIDVQEIGFALAVAILIDATVVRALLVPASMKLMGNWNWWTPHWLDRSLPTVQLAGEGGIR